MGFSWCVTFSETERNLYIFHKTKPLMNSPALCWFSNCLYSQVRIRQVPDDSFWRRWSAFKTRLAFVYIYICITMYNFTFETNVNFYICNVMVVYFTYYVHWIWYSTWSQPRKCFRLRFSGCETTLIKTLLNCIDF